MKKKDKIISLFKRNQETLIDAHFSKFMTMRPHVGQSLAHFCLLMISSASSTSSSHFKSRATLVHIRVWAHPKKKNNIQGSAHSIFVSEALAVEKNCNSR